MKTRTARLIGLAAALAAVSALAQPWRIAETRVQQWATAQLSGQLGLDVSGSGSGGVALLPTPRVIATDLKARSVDGQVELAIPRLRADIRLLALLAGRIEFDKVTLFAPQATVTLPDGAFDPMPLLTTTALANRPGTPHIAVREGGSVFFRRGPGILSSARDLSLDISARGDGEAVEAAGALTWRGEAVTFAFATDSPDRGTQPMARIRSDLVSLDFAAARRSPAGQPRTLEGQFELKAPSMSRLSAWLASGSPVLLPLGATAVSGSLLLSGAAAEMRSVTVALGADLLEGALDWRKRDGRWRLTGTLAGRSLSIGRPMSGIGDATVGIFDMQPNQVLDLDDLLAHDIDLRMSLQRVRLPGLTLNDVAAQIMATDSRFDLAVANSGLHRGVARARASISRVPAGVEVKAQMNADRVDLGPMTLELFEARRMTGAGSLQTQVGAVGRTLADLLGSAQGHLTFTARAGDFMGTNLNDAMRRIERQPLAVMRDWRGGRTQFDELVVNCSIVNGVMEVTEGRASGQAYRLSVGGLVSLAERAYRLAGNVHSATAQSIVPFEVTGPIGDPSVQVNGRALLERSGAVAPFLGGRD